MNKLDAILLSLTIGVSLFTLHLFASGDPSPTTVSELPSAGPGSRGRVGGIILHGLDTPHRRASGELPFHVFLDGERRAFAPSWGRGAILPHTDRTDVNALSLAVAIRSGTSRESLLRFLVPLCREFDLPFRRVLSHEEVDPAVSCPGPDLEMESLRSELEQRLKRR